MRPAQSIQALRSYRAFVYPITANAWDLEGQGGQHLLSRIDLKAASSEDAQEKARHVTGQAVLRVERKD
ncbi:hypothetical protein ACFIQF_11510 [Comamonas sp. J-3]|uniref:hypothetical protein n=1 Tax=Comamonas trifloxystrobinivorans TaxID=3350256 RepID=UPI00372928D5